VGREGGRERGGGGERGRERERQRERERKNNHGSNLLAQYTNSDSDSSNISTSSNTAACCDCTTLCGNTTLDRRSTVYNRCTSCWPIHLDCSLGHYLSEAVKVSMLIQHTHPDTVFTWHVSLILQQHSDMNGQYLYFQTHDFFFFFATAKILHHTPADFKLNVNPDLPSHHLAYSYRHTVTAFLPHYFHISVGRVA